MDEQNTETLFSHIRILFVDDEEAILQALKRLCKRQLNAQCKFVLSGQEALVCMQNTVFDVVVSDMRMPNMTGAEFLGMVAELYPDTIRIVLTGYSDKESIISAINQGRICGYINKPWDNDELIVSLKQAITTGQVMAERALLKRSLEFYEKEYKHGFADFIGRSLVMQMLYNGIERAAPSNASVFITGPSGAGKELAAKAIHQYSQRKDKPFVALNCAAIPHELMESEIFGHVKGAFSGAVNHRDGAASQANGGTLFLDELGEMDMALQAKLLRFIQTGKIKRVGAQQEESVDIRFVCATNRAPLDAIKHGKLREDLYYRLNVVSLLMPPLNERGGDIMLLANYFLEQFSQHENKIFAGFARDAERLLTRFDWPGNVRQLENVIHSMVVMNEGPLLTADHVAFALQLSPMQKNELMSVTEAQTDLITPTEHTLLSSSQPTQNRESSSTIVPLAEVERVAIERAIALCDANVVLAASKLAVSPSTLYRKMQQWAD